MKPVKIWTVSRLCRAVNTLDALDILARADRLFPVGRFHGGVLTAEELAALDPQNKAEWQTS